MQHANKAATGRRGIIIIIIIIVIIMFISISMIRPITIIIIIIVTIMIIVISSSIITVIGVSGVSRISSRSMTIITIVTTVGARAFSLLWLSRWKSVLTSHTHAYVSSVTHVYVNATAIMCNGSIRMFINIIVMMMYAEQYLPYACTRTRVQHTHTQLHTTHNNNNKPY